MGVIGNLNNFWVVSVNKNIFLLNKSSGDTTVLDIPLSKGLIRTNKRDNYSDDIVFLVISKNQQYCAVATLSKRLLIYNTASWSVLKEEILTKRPMAIVFTPDSSYVVVADKTGDVYLYSIFESDEALKVLAPYAHDSNIDVEPGPEALLGHLSMLLDLVVTDDGKFLITCDRDEKIRVSSYPNCYNIHTFCLGHTEFVSHIRLLQNSQSNQLLSASGDGKIILWNYLTGEKRCVLNYQEMLKSQYRRITDDDLENISLAFINILEISLMDMLKYILIISHHGLQLLHIYEFDSCAEQFAYKFSYETAFPLIDAKFIESRELILFMDVSEEDVNPFAVLRFSEKCDSACNVIEHSITKFGEKYKEKLKTKNIWSMDANSLYKHNKYDNVADYLKKKQERLNNCRNKPTKRKSSEL